VLARPPIRSKSKPSKTFLGPASRKSLRNYQLPRLVVPVNPTRDHIAGPVKAPLTLVEYGDFQCPYCGAAYPEVKQVQAALKSKLRFVYRHFPMTNVHEYAMSAAEISEAAAAQGRFWEMHDFLFEHQDTINDSRQAFAFAESLGLDTGRMELEIAQHVYQDRIREDFLGGVRSGVNGTPTFYVNGVRHDGEPVAESLIEALTSTR